MNLKPLDLDILRAVALRWVDPFNAPWVHEILEKPDHLIERRMERLIDGGYLEAGVSTRTAWLTDGGRKAIR